MTDLVEFLRARLDEDEQAAKHVRQPYRLYVDNDGRISEPKRVDDLHGERDGEYEQWGDGEDRMPNHIATWSLMYDPARVLREVEAKRRIVALHSDPRGGDPSCSSLDYPESAEDCETLRLLALSHVDHPDYREEWRL